MKVFIYILSLFLFFNNAYSSIPICPYHEPELKKIRSVAYDSLLEAFKLAGRRTGSYAITKEYLCWSAVKNSSRYTKFSATFHEEIEYYNKNAKFLASSRVYKGLDEIGDLFLKLYNNCILDHHNYQSVFERGKIHFDKGNIEACLTDIMDLLKAGFADEVLKDIKPSDLLITKAQAFIEVGEYEKAIEALSDVIKQDPKNKEAYFHRAAAYFESGNFDEALKDYLLSDKGKVIPQSTFEATKEFTTALLNSVCEGAVEATLDFVPSLCHSAYGLGETLWAYTPLNPQSLENTDQFVNACYEMAENIVDYCKDINWETVGDYVNQVKYLYEQFDQLSEGEKGNLIGYTIGKYGVDLFAGGAAVKSVSTYRKLRNANRMCNLEAMAISSSNKETIISSSLRHASERETFFQNI